MKIKLPLKPKSSTVPVEGSSSSASLLQRSLAKAKNVPTGLQSDAFSAFDDGGFKLPSDIHKVGIGELTNLMARITSFRSFLLARISMLRVERDDAQIQYKRAHSRKIRQAGVGESKKWLVEAELDNDPTLVPLENTYLECSQAVNVLESWALGLEEKHATLSREITVRGQDFATHNRRA